MSIMLDMLDKINYPLKDEDGDEEDSDLESEVGTEADKSVVPEWLKAELQDAKSEERRGWTWVVLHCNISSFFATLLTGRRGGKKKKRSHERREKKGGGRQQEVNSRVSQKKQKSEIWNVTYPSGFHRLDVPPEKNHHYSILGHIWHIWRHNWAHQLW